MKTQLKCCFLLGESICGHSRRNGEAWGRGWEARRPAQPACHSRMMDEPAPWLVISADWLRGSSLEGGLPVPPWPQALLRAGGWAGHKVCPETLAPDSKAGVHGILYMCVHEYAHICDSCNNACVNTSAYCMCTYMYMSVRCAKLLVKTKMKHAMRGIWEMLDFCLGHLK